jgi:hypothetical protein
MPYEETEAVKPEYDTEPNFDVEKVHDLLAITDLAKDYPNLKPIFDEALRTLVAMAAELLQKLEDEKKEAA